MNNTKYYYSVLFICITFFSYSLQAQTPPSNLEGTSLRDWLRTNLFIGKHNTLSYSDARERMFGFIDNDNGRVFCVYSGFEKDVPAGTFVTYPAPVNTEHTVPQSFYDGDLPMRSDIHHLFPTFEDWNSERGSNKFDEIPDNSTTKWMYRNNSQSNIPSSNIDDYAEATSSNFEPKEDHKGDLARAVFYFYTVYPSVGNITDVAALETLCAWNNQDPPNAKEMERNAAIETYQGNRNPYIDYLDLPERAWGCASVPTKTYVDSELLKISPNPARSSLFMEGDIEGGQYRILDLYGRVLQSGTVSNRLDVEQLAKGIYFINIKLEDKEYVSRFIKM